MAEPPFVLRNAHVAAGPATPPTPADVVIAHGRFVEIAPALTAPEGVREIDVAGGIVCAPFVNAHDHLDASTFPPLGRPPYRSLYEWTEDVSQGGDEVRAALGVPLVDRLFLGGLRNLLAGAAAVAHHGAFHRSLSRSDFPVRVLERYQFAHSPGLTPALRKTYRSTDRRIPWFAHVAEGVDERCAGELGVLADFNMLRHNLVLVHGIGLRAEDAPRLAEAGAALVWCPESNLRLYGATAPVAALSAAGVRVALGSDSPASGVRDGLSVLAVARRHGAFTDAELIDMSTRGAAEVARLPYAAPAPGAPADLLVIDSWEGVLAGERPAIAGVWRDGRLLYGRAEWVTGGTPVEVDGASRALAPSLGSRFAALLRKYPQVRAATWAAAVGV